MKKSTPGKKSTKKKRAPTTVHTRRAIAERPDITEFVEIGGSPVPGITLRQILQGHTGSIHRIAWSSDGRYLASPASDETIRIWDVQLGSCTLLEDIDSAVVSWSPTQNSLASGSSHGLTIWSNVTSERPIVIDRPNPGSHIYGLAWSPNGQRVAYGDSGGNVRILESNQYTVAEEFEVAGIITCLTWSRDSKSLAIGTLRENSPIIFTKGKPVYFSDELEISRATKDRGGDYFVGSLAWTADNKCVISGHASGIIQVWDVAAQRKLLNIEGHRGRVAHLALSSDGLLLASKSQDDTIQIWKTDTWTPVCSLIEKNGNNYDVVGLAFHPRLPVLASLGKNNTTVRIWDIDYFLIRGLAPAADSIRYTTAKLVLVGDSGVGKTGLGWRLAHGEFKEHSSTHGQQFWVLNELQQEREDGTKCEAVLWDLAGQHVYRSIHSIFLDNVNAALVVFDPSNRQDPLRGVQFWLEQLKGKTQLPSTVLVGARVDRGAPVLSHQELEQFCQRFAISGGYVSTSAKVGHGLDQLLEVLNAQIPWTQMTATVTTVTFKQIKEFILALKEEPERKSVLVSPAELQQQLEARGRDLRFTEAEMMTAVGHLQTHGYVTILRSSSGKTSILLTPDLLVSLASSIVLEADKNPRELGAISETELLQRAFPFDELRGLEGTEQQVLIDAAVLLFLEHNICFRETLGEQTLLIFPGLIKQKRPLQDDISFTDDISYIVRGRVENIYAMLVVLLGYTSSFTRINQWKNQAQFEMGGGEVCGFRLIEEREGEIEFVLYYGEKMPPSGRESFQGIFEHFLYKRDIEVARFPPVLCSQGHRQERSIIIKRVRERKQFTFCDECGSKIDLPEIDTPGLGTRASPWLQLEESIARLRSAYEAHLVRVKGYRRQWAAPRCYISHVAEQASWKRRLSRDLNSAGIFVIDNPLMVQPTDFIIILDTHSYQKSWKRSKPLNKDAGLIKERLADDKRRLISIVLEGDQPKAASHELRNCRTGDFSDITHYQASLFDLVLELYAIPFTHLGFAPLRLSLHKQWEETLAGRSTEMPGEFTEDREEIMLSAEYSDIAIITVLPEEYQAICGKIENLQPAPQRNSQPNLYAWRVGIIPYSDGAYSAAVGMMGRAGTVESTLATIDAIKRWNPRYVFFVGIAGGLKNVQLGDVVVADVIHGYEYGKIDKIFTPRSNWTYKTDIGLLNGAVAHSTSDWRTLIQVTPPVETSLKVISGEIASGNKVVDDPSNKFFREVVKAWPKLIAVEMEGAGAGNAIEHSQALGRPVSYMMIRGISDLPRSSGAEEDGARGAEERDAWKAYAADTAASFVISLISAGLPLPPR